MNNIYIIISIIIIIIIIIVSFMSYNKSYYEFPTSLGRVNEILNHKVYGTICVYDNNDYISARVLDGKSIWEEHICKNLQKIMYPELIC